MGLKKYIASQFAKPHGIGGKLACFAMNKMNKEMWRYLERQIKNDTTVLDIGFGNGFVLKRLLKRTNSNFFGIDISADMVKTATKKNHKAVKQGRLALTQSSIENIPFDKQFGQIYTMNTVYFWDDLQTALNEVYNKLQAGGEFLNVFRNKEWLDKKAGFTKYGFKKYTEQELLTATEKAGFKCKLATISPNTFCIHAEKFK